MTIEQFNTSHDHGIAISLGLVSGMSRFNMTALKISPDADTEVEMFEYTDAYVFPPDDGVEMEMVSTEAGANIAIIGLDENGEEKAEVFVSINGTLAIGKWSAINAMLNDGPVELVNDLTVQTLGGVGNIYAKIMLGNNRDYQGAFVIPSDHRALVAGLIISMQKAIGVDAGGQISVHTIPPNSDFKIKQFSSFVQKEGNTSIEFKNLYPEIIDPGTKIVLTVEATAASSNFLARLPIVLIKTTL